MGEAVSVGGAGGGVSEETVGWGASARGIKTTQGGFRGSSEVKKKDKKVRFRNVSRHKTRNEASREREA